MVNLTIVNIDGGVDDISVIALVDTFRINMMGLNERIGKDPLEH